MRPPDHPTTKRSQSIPLGPNYLLHLIPMLLFDIAAVNLGLFMGLVARYAMLVGLGQAPRLLLSYSTPANLWWDSLGVFRDVAPVLTVVALVVFALNGFYGASAYMHTRRIGRIASAATVAFLVFAVASYATLLIGYLRGLRGFTPYPRSALFAGWLFALALLLAVRQAAVVWVEASDGRLRGPVVRNRYFFAADLVLIALSVWLSFVARLDLPGLELRWAPLLVYLITVLLVKPPVYHLFGLYRRYWRYASIAEVVTIIAANVVATLGAIAGAYLIVPIFYQFDPVPRSVPWIDFLLATFFVGGARFLVRMLGDRRVMSQLRLGSPAAPHSLGRVVILGAGDAGAMIVREMQSNPELGLEPVVFLDDDSRKHSAVIHGVPVIGGRDQLADVVNEYQIAQAIIAMPTAPGKTIRELMRLCEKARIPVKTVPGVFELLDGSVTVNQLRPVEIGDLLRRESVVTDLVDVVRLLKDKRVLVTGAGGSIGSELCRQIAPCKPAELILLGHGENSLFEIANELKQFLPSLQVHTVVADIRGPERMRNVFLRYRPQIVFHAAAHKHVPLMEQNVEDAVSNNIQGTRQLLACAESCGVEHLVAISSDKAVNPTSVMGATKRVAELLVQESAARTGRCYVAVRFGNVLGSRGSVVPLFKQQIARGGPVTVTHPDICRYFMTIPEAVQLVLQAATLGKGGEVFVLDMGNPIKIVDLARDLIRLSGLEEGQDIDIVFTGLRPGEKLFEELFISGESHTCTAHEKVFVARDAAIQNPKSKTLAPAASAGVQNPNLLDACIDDLIAAAQAGNTEETRRLLAGLVPEAQNLWSAVPATSTGSTATVSAATSQQSSRPSSLKPAKG